MNHEISPPQTHFSQCQVTPSPCRVTAVPPEVPAEPQLGCLRGAQHIWVLRNQRFPQCLLQAPHQLHKDSVVPGHRPWGHPGGNPLGFQGSSNTPAAVVEPLGAVSPSFGLQALPQALLPASQSQNTSDTSKEHVSHGSGSTSTLLYVSSDTGLWRCCLKKPHTWSHSRNCQH